MCRDLGAYRLTNDMQLHRAASQSLDIVGVHAKSTTVLAKFTSARSLEEEFKVDQGVATTKTEFTEIDNGGGSGERLQRPRVWEDLMNLPEESGSVMQRNICFSTAVISDVCGWSS